VDRGVGAMQIERVREFYAAIVAAGMYNNGDVDPDAAVSLEFVNRGVGKELATRDAE
jgi:hypothetical protein